MLAQRLQTYVVRSIVLSVDWGLAKARPAGACAACACRTHSSATRRRYRKHLGIDAGACLASPPAAPVGGGAGRHVALCDCSSTSGLGHGGK